MKTNLQTLLTPALPAARPRSDRFRCGGRESKFLAVSLLFLALLADAAHADIVNLRSTTRVVQTAYSQGGSSDYSQYSLSDGPFYGFLHNTATGAGFDMSAEAYQYSTLAYTPSLLTFSGDFFTTSLELSVVEVAIESLSLAQYFFTLTEPAIYSMQGDFATDPVLDNDRFAEAALSSTTSGGFPRVIVGHFPDGSLYPSSATGILPAGSYAVDVECRATSRTPTLASPNITAHTTSSILNFRFSVHNFMPIDYWKQTHLGDATAPDSADPGQDGLDALLEYGLGLLPENTNTPPACGLFPYAEGRRLRMILPRDPSRSDVTVEVQATSDLNGPWTTLAISTHGAPFTGPGYVGGDDANPTDIKTVEVRDIVNDSDPGVSRRFMRATVSH